MYSQLDEKIRFAIVGSGWRSLYYVRIAEALPSIFELGPMLCRTEEKAEKMRAEYGIRAVTTEEECLAYRPDFIVAAPSKPAMADVAAKWLKWGIPVLCETPAFQTSEQAERLRDLVRKGGRLSVAEQYRLYPEISAVLKVLDMDLIGDPDYALVSIAHEYHGASLIRAFLKQGRDVPFKVSARTFSFPTVETLSRYERFSDGRISLKNRTLASFAFENGKAALYDFDSEQYRSPIRKNLLKIQGPRGEIQGRTVRFLDRDNLPVEETLKIESRMVSRESDNPNLNRIEEVLNISFRDRTLYSPPFGPCGLSEDETAMAVVLWQMGGYVRGICSNPYPLEEAAADILMGQALYL